MRTDAGMRSAPNHKGAVDRGTDHPNAPTDARSKLQLSLQRTPSLVMDTVVTPIAVYGGVQEMCVKLWKMASTMTAPNLQRIWLDLRNCSPTK